MYKISLKGPNHVKEVSIMRSLLGKLDFFQWVVVVAVLGLLFVGALERFKCSLEKKETEQQVESVKIDGQEEAYSPDHAIH